MQTVKEEYEEKITKIKAEKKPTQIPSKINTSGKPNVGNVKLKIPEEEKAGDVQGVKTPQNKDAKKVTTVVKPVPGVKARSESEE